MEVTDNGQEPPQPEEARVLSPREAFVEGLKQQLINAGAQIAGMSAEAMEKDATIAELSQALGVATARIRELEGGVPVDNTEGVRAD